MSKLNQAREQLLNEYVKALEENTIPWHRGWGISRPKNAISNKEYRGVNHMLLSFVAGAKGYEDNRWCTFKQANDNGWKINKGEKSTPIEFWSIYNIKEKRIYTQREYTLVIMANPELNKDFRITSRVYRVFNGEQMEGIPPYEKIEKDPIDSIKAIDKLVENMKVDYKEGGNRAYYMPQDDMVVLPPKNSFEDIYYYHATKLHELCHATGHSSRLNRDMTGRFGTQDYAKEELRAEISSSLIMQELDLKCDDKHIDRHKAYIQDWISVLKNDENELFKAIKEANRIVDYVEEKAELNLEKDKELVTVNSNEKDKEIDITEEL